LRGIGAGIVLASSKTAPELIALRDEMGLQGWPAIVENGAGILDPDSTDIDQGDRYGALRAILNTVPGPLRDHFHGFGDMDVQQIAQITGLSPANAALAARRAFSEPGLWTGDAPSRAEFLRVLGEHGVSGREGGRFLTLSFGQTKADRMSEIIARYHPRHTIALGDAPNDTEMLQTADFGVIVANPYRAPLPVMAGENTGRIIRTDLPGPDGWNAAILDLAARLEFN